MAVKVNFRMAAAAILDFAESEFLQQNRLWYTVFSPFAKFHAYISHSWNSNLRNKSGRPPHMPNFVTIGLRGWAGRTPSLLQFWF